MAANTRSKKIIPIIVDSDTEAADVIIDHLDNTTYDNLQDYINVVQSSGMVSDCSITDAGSGSVTVSAGNGFIKTEDSAIGHTKFFTWLEDVIELTDLSTNFIYIDYNNGTPIIKKTNIFSNINFTTKFLMGMVYREGSVVSILCIAALRHDMAHRMAQREYDLRQFERSDGLVIAGKISGGDTRHITMTAGHFYAMYNKIAVGELDTTDLDTFTTYYYDGDLGTPIWIRTTGQIVIDNFYYNAIATGLAELTPNQYGVHWVFMDFTGQLHVVYGQGSYNLGQANDALIPSGLTDYLNNFCMPIGKIIIKKSATVFAEIKTTFETYFAQSVVVNHNDLGGLNDGDYRHLTVAEYAEIITSKLLIVSFAISGKPTAGQIVNIPAPTGVTYTFPANLTGTVVKVGTNPTAEAVFTIKKNAASVATITISTAGVVTIVCAAQFVISGTAEDTLVITAPAAQDDTLENIGFALKGIRS